MTRPLTDLANDLRSSDLRMFIHEAADIIDLVERHLGPTRPPCDTCGGKGEVPDLLAKPRPCPDPHCDHGLLAWDEHLRRVAAVWDAVMFVAAGENDVDRLLDALRQIGRQP